MKERIIEFLKAENKSSAQFAEEIGVQPSGISHILSGRNNPSLDFVVKMLEKYKFLSTEWLLFGRGEMYKESVMRDLFEIPDINTVKPAVNREINETEPEEVHEDQLNNITIIPNKDKSVEKIVWFFNNNSFREFYPGK